MLKNKILPTIVLSVICITVALVLAVANIFTAPLIEKNQNGVAKTYGKGIMQTTYKLISGGAFKLTTAKIYLPDKKNSIHGVGFIATGDNAVDSQNALARAIQSLGQEKE